MKHGPRTSSSQPQGRTPDRPSTWPADFFPQSADRGGTSTRNVPLSLRPQATTMIIFRRRPIYPSGRSSRCPSVPRTLRERRGVLRARRRLGRTRPRPSRRSCPGRGSRTPKLRRTSLSSFLPGRLAPLSKLPAPIDNFGGRAFPPRPRTASPLNKRFQLSAIRTGWVQSGQSETVSNPEGDSAHDKPRSPASSTTIETFSGAVSQAPMRRWKFTQTLPVSELSGTKGSRFSTSASTTDPEGVPTGSRRRRPRPHQ